MKRRIIKQGARREEEGQRERKREREGGGDDGRESEERMEEGSRWEKAGVGIEKRRETFSIHCFTPKSGSLAGTGSLLNQ